MAIENLNQPIIKRKDDSNTSLELFNQISIPEILKSVQKMVLGFVSKNKEPVGSPQPAEFNDQDFSFLEIPNDIDDFLHRYLTDEQYQELTPVDLKTAIGVKRFLKGYLPEAKFREIYPNRIQEKSDLEIAEGMLSKNPTKRLASENEFLRRHGQDQTQPTDYEVALGMYNNPDLESQKRYEEIFRERNPLEQEIFDAKTFKNLFSLNLHALYGSMSGVSTIQNADGTLSQKRDGVTSNAMQFAGKAWQNISSDRQNIVKDSVNGVNKVLEGVKGFASMWVNRITGTNGGSTEEDYAKKNLLEAPATISGFTTDIEQTLSKHSKLPAKERFATVADEILSKNANKINVASGLTGLFQRLVQSGTWDTISSIDIVNAFNGKNEKVKAQLLAAITEYISKAYIGEETLRGKDSAKDFLESGIDEENGAMKDSAQIDVAQGASYATTFVGRRIITNPFMAWAAAGPLGAAIGSASQVLSGIRTAKSNEASITSRLQKMIQAGLTDSEIFMVLKELQGNTKKALGEHESQNFLQRGIAKFGNFMGQTIGIHGKMGDLLTGVNADSAMAMMTLINKIRTEQIQDGDPEALENQANAIDEIWGKKPETPSEITQKIIDFINQKVPVEIRNKISLAIIGDSGAKYEAIKQQIESGQLNKAERMALVKQQMAKDVDSLFANSNTTFKWVMSIANMFGMAALTNEALKEIGNGIGNLDDKLFQGGTRQFVLEQGVAARRFVGTQINEASEWWTNNTGINLKGVGEFLITGFKLNYSASVQNNITLKNGQKADLVSGHIDLSSIPEGKKLIKLGEIGVVVDSNVNFDPRNLPILIDPKDIARYSGQPISTANTNSSLSKEAKSGAYILTGDGLEGTQANREGTNADFIVYFNGQRFGPGDSGKIVTIDGKAMMFVGTAENSNANGKPALVFASVDEALQGNTVDLTKSSVEVAKYELNNPAATNVADSQVSSVATPSQSVEPISNLPSTPEIVQTPVTQSEIVEIPADKNTVIAQESEIRTTPVEIIEPTAPIKEQVPINFQLVEPAPNNPDLIPTTPPQKLDIKDAEVTFTQPVEATKLAVADTSTSSQSLFEPSSVARNNTSDITTTAQAIVQPTQAPVQTATAIDTRGNVVNIDNIANAPINLPVRNANGEIIVNRLVDGKITAVPVTPEIAKSLSLADRVALKNLEAQTPQIVPTNNVVNTNLTGLDQNPSTSEIPLSADLNKLPAVTNRMLTDNLVNAANILQNSKLTTEQLKAQSGNLSLTKEQRDSYALATLLSSVKDKTGKPPTEIEIRTLMAEVSKLPRNSAGQIVLPKNLPNIDNLQTSKPVNNPNIAELSPGVKNILSKIEKDTQGNLIIRATPGTGGTDNYMTVSEIAKTLENQIQQSTNPTEKASLNQQLKDLRSAQAEYLKNQQQIVQPVPREQSRTTAETPNIPNRFIPVTFGSTLNIGSINPLKEITINSTDLVNLPGSSSKSSTLITINGKTESLGFTKNNDGTYKAIVKGADGKFYTLDTANPLVKRALEADIKTQKLFTNFDPNKDIPQSKPTRTFDNTVYYDPKLPTNKTEIGQLYNSIKTINGKTLNSFIFNYEVPAILANETTLLAKAFGIDTSKLNDFVDGGRNLDSNVENAILRKADSGNLTPQEAEALKRYSLVIKRIKETSDPNNQNDGISGSRLASNNSVLYNRSLESLSTDQRIVAAAGQRIMSMFDTEGRFTPNSIRNGDYIGVGASESDLARQVGAQISAVKGLTMAFDDQGNFVNKSAFGSKDWTGLVNKDGIPYAFEGVISKLDSNQQAFIVEQTALAKQGKGYFGLTDGTIATIQAEYARNGKNIPTRDQILAASVIAGIPDYLGQPTKIGGLSNISGVKNFENFSGYLLSDVFPGQRDREQNSSSLLNGLLNKFATKVDGAFADSTNYTSVMPTFNQRPLDTPLAFASAGLSMILSPSPSFMVGVDITNTESSTAGFGDQKALNPNSYKVSQDQNGLVTVKYILPNTQSSGTPFTGAEMAYAIQGLTGKLGVGIGFNATTTITGSETPVQVKIEYENTDGIKRSTQNFLKISEEIIRSKQFDRDDSSVATYQKLLVARAQELRNNGTISEKDYQIAVSLSTNQDVVQALFSKKGNLPVGEFGEFAAAQDFIGRRGEVLNMNTVSSISTTSGFTIGQLTSFQASSQDQTVSNLIKATVTDKLGLDTKDGQRIEAVIKQAGRENNSFNSNTAKLPEGFSIAKKSQQELIDSKVFEVITKNGSQHIAYTTVMADGSVETRMVPINAGLSWHVVQDKSGKMVAMIRNTDTCVGNLDIPVEPSIQRQLEIDSRMNCINNGICEVGQYDQIQAEFTIKNEIEKQIKATYAQSVKQNGNLFTGPALQLTQAIYMAKGSNEAIIAGLNQLVLQYKGGNDQSFQIAAQKYKESTGIEVTKEFVERYLSSGGIQSDRINAAKVDQKYDETFGLSFGIGVFGFGLKFGNEQTINSISSGESRITGLTVNSNGDPCLKLAVTSIGEANFNSKKEVTLAIVLKAPEPAPKEETPPEKTPDTPTEPTTPKPTRPKLDRRPETVSQPAGNPPPSTPQTPQTPTTPATNTPVIPQPAPPVTRIPAPQLPRVNIPLVDQVTRTLSTPASRAMNFIRGIFGGGGG